MEFEILSRAGLRTEIAGHVSWFRMRRITRIQLAQVAPLEHS
jgi:hypothetical protein